MRTGAPAATAEHLLAGLYVSSRERLDRFWRDAAGFYDVARLAGLREAPVWVIAASALEIASRRTRLPPSTDPRRSPGIKAALRAAADLARSATGSAPTVTARTLLLGICNSRADLADLMTRHGLDWERLTAR